MKAVLATRTGAIQIAELPDPKIARGQVLIRVSHTAMDFHEEMRQVRGIAAGAREGRRDPVPIGGCASGLVEAVGEGVRRIKAGVRVAAAGYPYVFHAERIAAPENLVVELPKKVNHEEGAFAGQGAHAVHMLRRSAMQMGETAVVFGAELAGILLAQVLRAAGVTAIIVDASEARQQKARNLGLPHVLGVDQPDAIVRLVDSVSEGHGADAAFVTTPGDMLAVRAAAELLGAGCRLVIGAPVGEAPIPSAVLEKDLVLTTAIGPGPGRLDPTFELHGVDYPRRLVRWNERDNLACFCHLLAERKVQLTPLVTDRTPLERALNLYEKAQRQPETVMAGVFTI
jgi:NADPH:quinone reductase-like Zn-dependent oxidoreductase